MLRRTFVITGAAFALAGCANAPAPADAAARHALAPTGTLRIGVYSGSPTSYVRTADGREAGLALEMGRMLGERLGVPVRVVQYDRIALILQAMRAGEVDFTFTNATEERRPLVDFSPAILRLELGYLVPAGSKIASADEVDRAGMRIGVTEGSSSQSFLSHHLTAAKLVGAPSIAKAVEMIRTGGVDAYATNKGILFELADQLPGARVLPGRWGAEGLAIAYPKGREAGTATMRDFAERLRTSHELRDMVARAGLRGAAND
jgi:polar amino acid transport system substrate-binding protein